VKPIVTLGEVVYELVELKGMEGKGKGKQRKEIFPVWPVPHVEAPEQ
jgi:hypothetical protein